MSAPESTTPRPTLFLSYASEDRAAVRRLRDALGAAGLDVWYDENELGGGEAWDAKIRRQIRECDYFMPVISANTERRKEGYFRREWRLAVERTLDMADDVMFLLPVTLDGTSEGSARVPEKFLAVQWLRAPDGALTPALENLARRLAHGEHLAPQPPRGRTEPPVSHAAPPPRATPPPDTEPPPPPPVHDGPPPMPAFPKQQGQDLGHILKFLAEVIWWVVTAIWLLLRRAPRWMRLLIVLWAVLSFISYCTRDSADEKAQQERQRQAVLGALKQSGVPTPSTAGEGSPVVPTPPQMESAGETKLGTQLDPRELDAQLAQAKKALAESGLPASWAQFGTDIAGKLGDEIKRTAASGKHLVAIPFSVAHSEAKDEIADRIFDATWDGIIDARPQTAALITTPLPEPSDAALVALGQRLKATYILGARVGLSAAPTPEEKAAAKLHVSLLKVADGTLVWSGEFPLVAGDAKSTGERIAVEVLRAAPPR